MANWRVVKTNPLAMLSAIRMLRVCIYGAAIGRNKTNGLPIGRWWKVIARRVGGGSG